MQPTVRETYLHTEVMTATPQKLQLMLIEAAIRFARQTLLHWDNNQEEQAGETLIRCQEIVAEILGGLRPDRDPNLVRRVAAVYTYIQRQLTTAHLQRSAPAVHDVLRVLEIERDTWKEVCQQLGARRDAGTLPHPHAAFSA
jgi:flagellar protein FliS